MLDAGRGMLRLLRATVVLLTVVGLSSLAHAVGGGTVPGAGAWLVIALLLAPPVWWAVRKRVGGGVLFGLLAGAQVAVHGALVAMTPGSGDGTAAHVHGGLPDALAAHGPSEHLAHTMPLVPGPTMLATHLVATALLTVLLTRTEDALWHVVRFLLPAVPGSVRVVPSPRVPTLVPAPVLTGRSPRPLGGRAPPPVLS